MEMKKVSLVEFQRHLLLTHIKDNANCVLGQVERHVQRSNESFADFLTALIKSCWKDQTAYCCNHWYRSEIPLSKCYFAQDTFRDHPVPKDKRICDFLDEHANDIESNFFPMAWEIKKEWKPMPPLMVEERDPDDWTRRVTDSIEITKNDGRQRYYVLDGELRVIRHWYHKKPIVPAYIYRGEEGKV